MVNKAKEAQQLTDDVADKRRRELTENFPAPDRAQYTSEEAYREALLTQYRRLRQQEYESICLSEGTVAFDAAVRCGGNMNQAIFNKQKGMASDSLAYRKIAEGDIVRNPTKYRGSFCCAVSACAVEAAICERMGVEGLVKCDSQNMGAANLAPFSADQKVSGRGKEALWDMIEQGIVGPGDQISRASSRSNSGRHAEVIVAVNYDENGKLKNYVIQANNRTKLQVIDANTEYPPKVKKNGRSIDGTFEVGRMNSWMGEQLDREAAGMRSLSTKELEERLAAQKDKTHAEIAELEKAEQHLFSLQTGSRSLRDRIDAYADSYIKNAGVPAATPAIIRTDQGNAQQEASRQERRAKMFSRQATAATNAPREDAYVATEVGTVHDEVVYEDTLSDKEKAQMRSMLNNLNRTNGKKKVDVEAAMSALTQQFGADAVKVLTKIMMVPEQIAKQLDLKNEQGKPIRSSREVLNQLCNPQNDEQSRQVLAIVNAGRRGRSMA